MYTTVQKFGVWSKISHALQDCNLLDQKYSKNNYIVKYYYNLKYNFCFNLF